MQGFDKVSPTQHKQLTSLVKTLERLTSQRAGDDVTDAAADNLKMLQISTSQIRAAKSSTDGTCISAPMLKEFRYETISCSSSDASLEELIELLKTWVDSEEKIVETKATNEKRRNLVRQGALLDTCET